MCDTDLPLKQNEAVSGLQRSAASTMYMVKWIIENVGCDKVAIRNELHAVRAGKGLLITYVADQHGDLAHTMGIYRKENKQTELIGTLRERGF